MIPEKYGPLVSLFRAYILMLAQCGTTALLFGTGDIITQQLIEKKDLRRHDMRNPLSAHPSLLKDTQFTRTVRLTFYGGAFFGTVCHYATRPLEDVSLVI
ncbi:hypothetical protein ARMSODRAFT_320443 [Armillaria solidipes]|uniref:Uncharacterized protein n=1 Tax=Armillaria solidipes TaxID=1076256 RepID=A0A2H3BE14_9AGAR|nr:hypothetical protein ARMSODRAFT_320443 [Armillaria solidipes]